MAYQTIVIISGFCILVRLLHELLLPWFAVRNAIRCNDHETLDWSWRYFVSLFRATRKHQYAAYGVQQATAAHMICPSVRAVWDEHRTAHNNTQTWAQLERSAAANPHPAFSREW